MSKKLGSGLTPSITPTVRTISRLAGVSSSTVSRALKGDLRISKKTRAAVVAIASEQGYTPNAMARGLVTRTSGVVGIVLGNMENPFYAELVEVLYRRLVEIKKYPMLLHIGGETLDSEAIKPIRQYQMDGCIIATARLSSKAAETCATFLDVGDHCFHFLAKLSLRLSLASSSGCSLDVMRHRGSPVPE